MKKCKIISILSVVLICLQFIMPYAFENVLATGDLHADAAVFYTTINGETTILPDLAGATNVSASAIVSNTSGLEKKAGIYLAYYSKRGELLEIDYKNYTVSVGETKTITAEVEMEKAPCFSYAKCFIWDETAKNHTPIIKAKVLNATENIYVSPNGNDEEDGTFSAPVKTLHAAKNLADAKNDDMKEDLFVYLKEGTYTLNDTLVFDSSDSGTNGKTVNYKSYNGENAVISGGKKIENWEVYDEAKNIWRAQTGSLENIRELYVGGKKALRAKTERRIYPKGFYTENEKIKGYVASASDAELYNNAQNIQLHFSQVWKNTLLNVDEIKEGEEGTIVFILNDKAFSKTITSTRYVPLRGDTSFYVENAFELLDSEGEFYFDEDAKYIYYKPHSSVNMKSAEVIVPVLEKFVEIKGDSLNEKAENISFEGITFAHATRSDMDSGYLGDQAQTYDPIYPITSSYPVDNTFVGANIRVHAAKNITFKNNVFTGLSAVGIGLYDGAENIEIKGNCFYDLGDSAITAGLPTDAFMEDEYESGVNVALFKNVTSNGAAQTSATFANDGDRTTIWSNPTNSSSDYLQIDLEKEYAICEVRLKSRLGLTESATETYKTQTVHRRGFKVYASNDADFSDGGTVLATVSNTSGNEFDYDEGYVGKVATTEKFRYIRFSTTVNKYFPLAEIEIISPDKETQNKEVCKNNIMSNNYITRIGDTNWGAPGIQLYHTENINVLHNTLKDVPYSGICVGWGWNNKSGSQTTKNNTVNYNVIDGFANRMYDAGGVYLNGPQINTQINYNYIKNQKNIYYALYSDSGSDSFTATNNVFEDVDYVFALGREGNPTGKKDILVKDNYSTSVKYNFAFTESSNSVIENPVFYLKTKPSENISALISNAGIEDDYKNIITKVPNSSCELKTEDIYGNVIDRHVGYYSDTITSLTDYNLVLYYLSNKIDNAKKILEAGKEYTSDEAYLEFKNSIASIEKIRTSYYAATAPTEEEKEAGGTVHTTENLDRIEVINTRIVLETAIEDYLNSFSN